MKGIRAAALHTGDGIVGPAWLLIDDGRVIESGQGQPPIPDCEESAGTIVPGLVDMHSHGRWNVSFDRDHQDDVASMAERSWSRGVTSVVATVATAPLDLMTARLRTLAPLVADGTLAGIHLEGPYLAASRRGAHAEHLLREPDVASIAALVEAADGALRMVTIAPELPRAIDVIRFLVSCGVVVALGHSDATMDEARRAIDAGATVATHLFNGMRSWGHREPGVAGACLFDDRVTLEVIADGRHVHPEVVAMVQRLAADRVAFVSDSMPATDAGDGRYELAGSMIDVMDGIATTTDTGSLAGSTTPLDAVFSNADLPLDLDRFASYSSIPADALGAEGVGRLVPGSHADLVLVDPAAPAPRVMRRGQWIDESGS